MVRFYGLCDGKISVRKTSFFLVFVWKCLFFSQNFCFWRALSNWEQLNNKY